MNEVPTPMKRILGREWEAIIGGIAQYADTDSFWLMFSIISGHQTVREAVAADILRSA